MNYYLSFFFVLLFTFIPNVEADGNLSQSNVQQVTVSPELQYLSSFYAPIKFTQPGIRCFFKHVFNSPEYAIDFLPYTFTHMLQFLDYGFKSRQAPLYIQSILRLFYNKIKASHYITSYALHELIEQLPPLLEAYSKKQEFAMVFDQAQVAVKDLLYTTFLQRFSFFKKNPVDFFNDLSSSIMEEVQKNLSVKREHESIHQAVLRFMEIALNKVVWPPVDDQELWRSIILFGNQLHAFYDANIINEDELDDLYRTLIERFCYYLHIHGGNLSLETVAAIRKSIDTDKLHFLELEEQELYLESKKNRLQRALVTTEAKIHARLQGIIPGY